MRVPLPAARMTAAKRDWVIGGSERIGKVSGGTVARRRRNYNTQILAEYIASNAKFRPMQGFLLVFDLDGTLVDSVPDLRAALNQMLRERGRRPLTPPQVKWMVGDGVPALVTRALAASGADPAESLTALPRFLEIYEANAARLTRPYPGVPETLTVLRRRGYRTAICTNKPQRATTAVLRGLDLLQLFDGIAGGDRFAVRKPDPGHLLALLAELGAASDEAAMIGDNENDAAAAHGAAVPLVLMRYGYARVDPASLAADALLDRFRELPRTLDRLGLTP
jgi:phosphoglycolate phosphatase